MDNIRGRETTYGDDVFSQRLRALMEDQNVTQQELANVAGVTRQTVSLYAEGTSQPKAEKLQKIAQYLKVSTDYLVGLSNVQHPYSASAVDELGLSELSIECIKNLRTQIIPTEEDDDRRTLLDVLDSMLSVPSIYDFLRMLGALSSPSIETEPRMRFALGDSVSPVEVYTAALHKNLKLMVQDIMDADAKMKRRNSRAT